MSPVRVLLIRWVGRSRRSCHSRPVAGFRLGRGQPHRGVGAALGVAQQRPGELVEGRQRRLDAGSVRPAGVGGPDHDTLGRPALRQHRQQFDLGALAAGVGGGRGVLPHQVRRVVGAQPLAVHPARGHEHDAGVVPGQRGTQQVGHQHRPEQVQRHRHLVALRRLGAGRGHRAGVVDEDVEPLEARLAHEPPYVVEVGDVAAVHGQGGPGHAAQDLVADPRTLVVVPDHQVHLGAEPGQALGGGQAEAGGRAGDDGNLAGQGVRCRVGRPAGQPAADRGTDPREARCDGAVEQGVDAAAEPQSPGVHARDPSQPPPSVRASVAPRAREPEAGFGVARRGLEHAGMVGDEEFPSRPFRLYWRANAVSAFAVGWLNSARWLLSRDEPPPAGDARRAPGEDEHHAPVSQPCRHGHRRTAGGNRGGRVGNPTDPSRRGRHLRARVARPCTLLVPHRACACVSGRPSRSGRTAGTRGPGRDR